jgi:ribonuclease D
MMNRNDQTPVVETKGRLKKRLIQEGRWEAALEFRERLKKEGTDPRAAWRRVSEQFPPIDGSRVVYVEPWKAKTKTSPDGQS